jgi:predicted nuclease of restriction endonuclease-like (RecB) superfamily
MNYSLQNKYIDDIVNIINEARRKAYTATACAMIEAYWLVGKRIVIEEQDGDERACYGKAVIEKISQTLGKGFSSRALRDFRQFYKTFPDWNNLAHMCAKLNWSHLRLIMRVPSPEAREYYLKEASEHNWAVRTLDRNISTQYYHRLLATQVKAPVIKEMQEKTAEFQADKFEFIKNPSVLEFLNLPSNMGHTEQQLEAALINNLQKFLLELGKGYAFVERQQHIRTDTSDFYIDLVFYNYILRCFVIIELKTNKLTHQDIGQLDMYVRMYDDLKKQKDDNPTIGILLCTETDKTIAKYSVLKDNKQLFATKYMEYLPTEEELVAEIEREKLIFKQQHESGVE